MAQPIKCQGHRLFFKRTEDLANKSTIHGSPVKKLCK